MAVEHTITLLPPEQVGPKGWIRNILCLKLDSNYDSLEIERILRTAWSSFKARTPMVGVELVPVGGDAKPAGLLKLQAYADGEINDFVVKDHRTDRKISSFTKLQEQNFPNAAMDNDKLCLRGHGGEWPVFGVDRLATQMMQANLIDGGLLLNHLCFHATADATSMWKLTELFAEDVRRAQGIAIEQPAEVPTADRAKLLQNPTENICANFADEHQEFVHLPFTPPGLPDGLTKSKHHAHVFRFTPDAIRALKDECAPSNLLLLKDQVSKEDLPGYVSTNDVLSALLWRSIQRAENPDLSVVADDAISVLQVSLDARRRAHIPVHRHTLGNILGYTAAVLPLSQVVSPEKASLADLALLVRQAVSKCGKSYYGELAHYVENMDDVNRLAGTAFLDLPGKSVLQSNWSEFDYAGIEWGPAFGGHIKAVRFPAGGVCAGFQVVMPPPADAPQGTYEILADVTEKGWPRLLSDEIWNNFAVNPTTVEYK
ncbi:hypothetical protein BD289DRAFT_438581 [Coniella lustricola]|uniref:Transferase family-domain-containing protein n=1 Tax=Coniella lustricola TaxID=2025994 RepID=A0A2T3A2R9_9PEZI|nr:hypothetical protein BD289DRAFT_438581 [Coniella lustricola]